MDESSAQLDGAARVHQSANTSVEKSTELETAAVQGIADEGTEGQGESARDSPTD